MEFKCNASPRVNKNEIAWSKPIIKHPLGGTLRKDIALYRKTIRHGLPLLTWREIRRHRLPHHESLCSELEEDGFEKSASYLKELFRIEEDIRNHAGPDTIIWNRPRLKDQYIYLEQIRNDLSEAETAKNAGNHAGECKALLKLAVYFMIRHEGWWWIAESMFSKCVGIVDEYPDPHGGQLEATVRYLYGRLLVNKLVNPQAAFDTLQAARSLSMGQSWNAESVLGCPQESIFIESCCLLHKVLLYVAYEIRSGSPDNAIRLCTLAIRRALEAEHPELEAEALLGLGGCEIEAQDPNAAILTLTRYLDKASKLIIDMRSICRAHLEIALCYKAIGDQLETLRHLENFKIVADTNNLMDKLGAGDRYLGEYYLALSLPDNALSSFMSAFSMYHHLGMQQELEQTRGLAGIAMGQTIMPVLADYILMGGEKFNAHAFARLLRWKNAHTPFWEVSETSLDDTSLEEGMYEFLNYERPEEMLSLKIEKEDGSAKEEDNGSQKLETINSESTEADNTNSEQDK